MIEVSGLDHMAPLVDGGRIGIDDNRVLIDRHRQELARVVASASDAYLARDGRHPVAV